MSEDLFYNRDRNISGLISPDDFADLALNPVYGSKATFQSKVLSYETDDFYFNTIPNSINNLSVSYDLRYDTNEDDCRKLVDFFESKLGYNSFVFNPDKSGIYRSNKSFCDNYAINYINNNHYEFAINVSVDQSPGILNWSGMSILNYNLQIHETGIQYKKFDIAYMQVNENKLSNFFYCSGDHVSSAANSPTGANSKWTQEFFFAPDIGLQNDVRIQVEKLEFKNSFPLRIKTKNNTAKIDISYKFTNVSDKQIKCMLHFLENKAGYRKFKNFIPAVYNRPKVFMCPQWTHTWKYFNAHDLEVSFIEDPLGIIQIDT